MCDANCYAVLLGFRKIDLRRLRPSFLVSPCNRASFRPIVAGIAQLVEQLICNQQVVGSNPSAGSGFDCSLPRLAPRTIAEPARDSPGDRTGFNGIDALYEPPEDPEIVVRTHEQTAAESMDQILAELLPRLRLSNG